MEAIEHVAIIYNPKSTRAAKANAKRLSRRLYAKTGCKVYVSETNHAGHAEELAREFAQKYQNILIVSSSGDGGYHEVINGVLAVDNDRVAVGLLPSGNANDHYKWMHRGRLIKRLRDGVVTPVDVIEVRVNDDYVRYAHSYAGLGFTAEAARQINSFAKRPTSEVGIVLRTIAALKPVRIRVDDAEKSYTNLIIANIGKMSKYFSIEGANSSDGMFEIIRNKTDKTSELAAQMARALTFGLEDVDQASELRFTCIDDTIIQMDGEVHDLRAGDDVRIVCRQKLLKTII